MEEEFIRTAEAMICGWDFFGGVREEAKRKHLNNVLLAALSRKAVQRYISAIDLQFRTFLAEDVSFNDHNIFYGDVIDGLLESAVKEYNIRLAVTLQVRSSDNAEHIFAELEDIVDVAVLLKLHDLVMLKKGSVMR